MRIGELLALRWQDVDLETERAALRVRRTKSTAKSGPVFTTPKNGKGRPSGSHGTLSRRSRPIEPLRTPNA
jgi:integrase